VSYLKLLCKIDVQDKHTGKFYKAGKSYDFKDKERADEVLATKFFEKPQSKPTDTEQNTTDTDTAE